jgi:isocitrate lyase
MSAFAELQQHEVGTGYFDTVTQTLQAGTSSARP